ncbi:alpha/beta fold hydrolase [Clostridium oryzae]|uniref:Putative carboxylesterase nap n=1 Tax=Clostridium oryzae TaxID=1450648 RepID=A0A1V4ISV7_9CLOT|nr:alpha/beta hydrolase [Clostridium oryzae]OPJ62884.1 putative carboxylesterase nap [Clostridium oryzae]
MKIYKNEKAKRKILETYNKLLTMWGVDVEEKNIDTKYGTTHVITCGDEDNPPLVLFHGVGDDSALMWIYNAKELSKHFRIYAVDTMGGPGKSCPNENYNKSFDEILWIDEVFIKLNIEKAYVAGVSNGSYMTHHYGIMRPKKVIRMVCMAGSVSTVGSPHPIKRMMKVFLPEALFPTQKNMIRLIKKLSGEHSEVFTDNDDIMEHYLNLLKGFNNMAMSKHRIDSFNDDQISRLSGKCLFLIGEADPLGDLEKVREKLEKHKLEYQFFKGVGHGINHEISETINKRIIEYFVQ